MTTSENEIILDLVETCIEALNFVEKEFSYNKFFETKAILENMILVINKIEYTLNNNKSKELLKDSILYCKNIEYSVGKILIEIQKERIEAKWILLYELIPFLKELNKQLSFELKILPYPEKWQEYRVENDKKMSAYRENIDKYNKKYKYMSSITVKAYNNLEYTKLAIESIFKYTDFSSGKYELITINNGSSDGTEEYFSNLPHTKKVNLKYNIPGTQVAQHIVEGKYGVSFSNDAVATESWLDNLLLCMESDNKIIWAVPTCNKEGISNNQGVVVPYENSVKMIKNIYDFGEKYNRNNELLWEERTTLMPFVSIVRSSYNNSCNGIDRLYQKLEFIDDDLSTSFRRAGLKQILAKDTFMHHFGSVTLKDNRKNGESIIAMREVYYKKWGVDAWDSRGEFEGIEKIVDEKLFCKNTKILFVEPRFGGNYLKIKNHIKSIGKNIGETTALVVDQRYYPDAKYMYDNIVVEKNITDFINKEVGKYELITFGTFLNDIVHDEIVEFIEKIYQLLSINGQLVFAIKNFRNAKILIQLISNNLRDLNEYDKVEFFGCNFPKFLNTLINRKKVGEIEYFQIVGNNKETDIIINMDNISYSQLSTDEQEEIRKGLDTDYFIVSIKRNA